MSVEDTISRPYAKAIFENAIQNNTIEEWKKNLTFINEIASHEKVKKFLSGSLSPKFLSSVFILISAGIIDENMKNFIKILADNQRFKILKNILEKFLILEAHHKNMIIVELRSACVLKDKNIRKIRKILEQNFLKKTKFIYSVDPRILNGVIIKVDDTIFDLSAQNYLKQLSNALNF